MTDIEHQTESYNQVAERPRTAPSPHVANTPQTPDGLCEKYCFVRELGHGSQAKVFEAIELATNEHVAIKELCIDSVKTWKEYDLFMREAKVLQSINFDGVAKFHEAIELLDQPAPRAYIVQAFIPGRSIAQTMASGFRLNFQHVCQIAIELIDLLEKLHKHDPPIIHRDIKPSNIMLTPQAGDQYKPYLIDFGAVANPVVQSGGSTIAGTYGYMPPEQLMGRPTSASDIYALAATLVYLLTGVDPATMQVNDFRLVIEPAMQNQPQVVTRLMRQMLAPDASNRLCDYDKLRNAFKAFLNNDFSNLKLDQTSNASRFSLKKVTHLGQAGNIDLWSELPDQVPREIPKLYKTFDVVDMNGQKTDFSSAWHTLVHSNNSRLSNNKFSRLLLAASFILGPVVIIVISTLLAIIVTSKFKGALTVFNYLGSINFFVFYILTGLISVFITSVILRCKDQNKIRQLAINIPDFDHKTEIVSQYDEDLITIQKIIKTGTKTIATVIDICLLPPDIEYEEDYVLNYNGHEQFATYYHGIPNFVIRYSFNPPEDNNPNDLIQAVVVHHDPTLTLQPGSPLPILYMIKKYDTDQDGPLRVISMPYPFPVEDIVQLNDIFYEGN